MNTHTVSKVEYAKTRMDYVCLIHSMEFMLKEVLQKLYDGKYIEAEDIMMVLFDEVRNLSGELSGEI